MLDVDRNPHPRPHSAIPRSSQYSASFPLHSSPMNGGGGGVGDGTGGTGGVSVAGEQSNLDHRTINHRMLATQPEVSPSGLNGSVSSSFHHPRTVSFDNSTDTGDAAMKAATIGRDETKERRHNSRRLTSILRRSVNPRRSTPAPETQRQHWMSPTSSVSNLNFSGTPDFIPASVYRPLFPTSEEYAELIENQVLGDVAMVTEAGNDWSQTPRANTEARHAFSSVGPTIASTKGQLSEVSHVRGNSLLAESKRHQITTTKSFDNDNRLQQMTLANHQQPLYTSQTTHRSEKGRRDSDIRKHSGDVNLKGVRKFNDIGSFKSGLDRLDNVKCF